MNCLQKEFETLLKSYERKRKRFEKKIVKWRNAGKEELASQGSQLLHEVDACLQDIKLGCTQTAEGLESFELLQDRYKHLKNVMAEFDRFMQPSWQRLTKSIVASFLIVSMMRLFV